MARPAEIRAQFYEGPGRFRAGTQPCPEPGPGQTLLRVRRVGICGTDLHIFQGHLDHRIPRGGIIGHETAAEVAEPAPGSGFLPGERVVVEPVLACGACRACRMGATYLCYRLRIIGVEEPGGMRDYHAVPTDRLLRVPLALTDEVAALIEPLAVAVHDVTRAAVESGEAALVLGGGPIGALIALVCRHRGARVAVSEVNPFRVDLLRGLGLEVLGPGTDVAAFVEAWTEGAGADVVFEVTGQPAAVRLMTDVVRVWGRVSVVAIHAEPMPVALYPVFARELSLHGSRLYTRAAWHEAIGLAASGTLPLAPLVTHVVPLGDLMDGLQAALRGGPVMKVLVDATR